MIAVLLVSLVVIIHIGIVLAEMVWWETPTVRRAFGTSPEFALNTRVLAANQGLYNGFLVAGLIWALFQGLTGNGQDIAHFFLACVIVAGLFGAATASRRILYVQTLPAALALLALLLRI
jgi:putative membrane protein